ncbi:uncharacterized protein MICPUCDRAFT_63101 [Micromonas pusilla CCMP1545]|uniref:Predicted protein n=1 Tax=Micromonas pusilla (strain CCMP1545) TaxID=564608 RepID=C1N1H7_MICPC|nr:uncharacterized protein MICPUCDRAFT_63101 [Micromonas pusilla CCMP1545]EEH54451.1 predicted protein [Micromonas pusilla CCMP1545]|eukprot:XP_003061821.1 predicted protein [Micromonas pusilla CCMP1545]
MNSTPTFARMERPKVAVVLRRLAKNATQKNGPHSFQITSPYRGEGPPAIRALDCRPPAKPGDELPMEFVFGTNRCEVWEIEYKPGAKRPTVSVQVYGHMADLYAVATHPRDPNVFATASAADRVYLWNAAERNMVRTAPTGVVGRSVAFSVDPVPASAVYFPGWTPPAKPKPKPKPGQYDVPNPNAPVEIPAGHHLAIGGKFGNVAIIDAVTLQPLAKLKESAKEVSDLKYCQGPRPMLAVGSHDLCVDVYDVERGYVHLSRCQGHQASINHLDWSLPMTLHGVENRRVLQTSCASYEVRSIHWSPYDRVGVVNADP